MSVAELLRQLLSCGVGELGVHVSHRRMLEQMSPAQRELVALVAHAAWQNGSR